MAKNYIQNLDISLVDGLEINLPLVKQYATAFGSRRSIKGHCQASWLLRAITCIDLTTLSGDDMESNVKRLCHKAANPLSTDMLAELNFDEDIIKCGAVCVYPAKVASAANCLKKFQADIPIAAVATGFPSGQYSLDTRLAEIKFAISSGASEIDIVINRELALKRDWKGLYEELVAMKEACGNAKMKTILAVGELGSLSNVYQASIVAMMAGSDFIKTSTGKESVNATLPVGVVMCRAIRQYYNQTGIKVGFKPAGGIRTAKDALLWLLLIKEELGNEWLHKDLFRIGASSLLTDIEIQLYHYIYGRYPAGSQMPMA